MEVNGLQNHDCPWCMFPVAEGEPCPACGRRPEEYERQSFHLPSGTVLMGRYMLGASVDRDGFSNTYMGLDLQREMTVTVKEFFPADRHLLRQPDDAVIALDHEDIYLNGLKSFLQDAQMIEAMKHIPSVERMLCYFEAYGTAYMIMEYVEGQLLLSQLVKEDGRIPPDRLMNMMRPLARDLGVMHGEGVFHRGIAPDSMMLLPDGTLRLTDFSCAQVMQRSEVLPVWLKSGFAPVEQYTSRLQCGPYTDVYGLSATIYYCLTGIVPPSSIERLEGKPLVSPRGLGVALSEKQEHALLWGMSLRPKERPQSVQALWEQLDTPSLIHMRSRICGGDGLASD